MTPKSELIGLAEQALYEMAPLEAGYFLRDLGLDFPTTMSVLGDAKKNTRTITRTVKSKNVIKKMIGVTSEQIEEAEKLEIIEYMEQEKSYTRFCLRGQFNKIIAQTKARGHKT